ncbi:O-acyltransferase WSD1-like protein [Carex littledalei]|uniref:O-acyltransferase WSD1-like protein n=1 Tax=Carex littledalei TaxID=544730 RepID=A0A833R144_9POAL|nr:O-acyltransferase WSD1-like protein [Carex littledalei]
MEEIKDQCLLWDEEPPVSPTGQYFNSSALSVSVLAVFESEIPIDDSPTVDTLENTFLPINPRFSSIMIKDENGVTRWKKVKVNLEDHINIPSFPPKLELYDDYVNDYMSKIALNQLSQSKPLWEIHIIKYPTKTAQGTLVFKLHHALGDGFSLMGALFSCVQRADDPSKPLTFPSHKAKMSKKRSLWSNTIRGISMGLNTVKDFSWSLWKSTLGEDDLSPVRSGEIGVEFRPVSICSNEFGLDDIKRIKDKIGGTINDVISGVVFYGLHLYMLGCGHDTNASKVTALVLLNTRNVNSYQTLEELTKPKARTPWGNNFGFLHATIPKCENAKEVDPLFFVTTARKIIKSKRSSLCVFLTGRFLEIMRKIRGPEVTAKYIHATLKNTSMTISNLTGPMEQMIIAGHPVKSFHFMVVGVPQSLTITVVSYMGKLKVVMGAQQGFINSQHLTSCMKISFQRILEASKLNKT